MTEWASQLVIPNAVMDPGPVDMLIRPLLAGPLASRPFILSRNLTGIV